MDCAKIANVVDWVQDGDAALAALSTATFSALVLDLGLPMRYRSMTPGRHHG